jgi:hypothetical protein
MAETMHEYLSSIRVMGSVDGQPARAAVSLDGEHDLLEIDGEDAE